MTSIDIPGKGAHQEGALPFALDSDGFLLDSSSWTEETARVLAELRGLSPLNRRHWAVIYFVRDRYLRLGAIPPIRTICRSSEISRSDVKALFGSCLDVWRVAGLPDPGEEAKTYMS